MTPEDVIAILYTISKFYSGSYAGISEEEAEEAIDYAINAVRQESYRNLDSNYGINSSTKIQADNFFGYDDDQFFTRDDEIDYIEIPLEEYVKNTYGLSGNFRCYIEGKQLEVDCSISGIDFTISCIIDFRKIRRPNDLNKYVVSDLQQQIDANLAEYQDYL